MTDLRAAAQQALEALCSAVEPKKGKVYARGFEPIDCYAMHEQAITALREALARENAMHEGARLGQEIEQPEQEPCIGKDPRCPCQDGDACHYKDCGGTKALPVPVAQPEPSAWREMVVVSLVREGVNKHKARELADHFAAQRQWVGLEPKEILDLFDLNNVYGSKWIEFARTVEAKLKERNT